jgi:HAD superfamily hydrolase (TIGR01484 family)
MPARPWEGLRQGCTVAFATRSHLLGMALAGAGRRVQIQVPMRYLALAADYDQTLATGSRLPSDTEGALRKLRRSGRRMLLLTGRTLDELTSVCPGLDLFDCVVLENGGVLYVPSTRQSTLLCHATALALIPALEQRGVKPIIRGQVLLATRRPHEVTVLEAIRDLGLELQIIFNGHSVMVLPSGVNKGSGLREALRTLGLSVHEVVGVGDAANDHSFLEICECAVAVHNAIPSIKAKADFCTRGSNGLGVAELIDELVANDLASRAPGGGGDVVVLASHMDGPLTFRPYGQNILISGPSSAGKSTFATALIERLIERDFQVCIIDPEGDYSTLDGITTVGHRLRAPSIEDVLERLANAEENVVVNLLGVPFDERPSFFSQLFPRLQALRARSGRPHWLVIDEVHHLLPESWGLAPSTLPQRLGEMILITHQPREVTPAVLGMVDIVVAVGAAPEATLAEYAAALGLSPPEVAPGRGAAQRDARSDRPNEVVIWQRTAGRAPCRAVVMPPRSERLRHLRKYAEGNLGHRGFFFRGREGRLNLRAVNLTSFCDMAAGVDDETWLFHLQRGDYASWFHNTIKDEGLAREVVAIAAGSQVQASDSRRLVRDAIERRYMLPYGQE